VKIEEISELHYITPMKNVPSILQCGILSHNRAAKLNHDDISMREIQDVRAKKRVPGGLALHDYANLYFNGRNKMMATRRPEQDRLCVLRVSTEALNSPAPSSPIKMHHQSMRCSCRLHLGCRNFTATRSLCVRGNQIREWRLGSLVCAELLVPHVVSPKLILGAYVLDGARMRCKR
jgi:hypothetical protein